MKKFPLLVLISGWGYPPFTWEKTTQQLSSLCEVRVLDPQDLLAREATQKMLLDTMETTRPCYLGGWSLGGMIAIKSLPDLAAAVRGVLLIATTPRFCVPADPAQGVDPRAITTMCHGLKRKPREILQSFYQQAAHPFCCDPEGTKAMLHAAKGRIGQLTEGLQFLLKTDLRHHPAPGNLPTAIIHGEKDQIVPHRAGGILGERQIPSCFELVPGIGHDLPLRRPDIIGTSFRRLEEMCK